MLIGGIRGGKAVRVKTAEGTFEVGVPLAEVVSLLERLWPWELGRHVAQEGDSLRFMERIPFERVVLYLLARRGGLAPREAEALAANTRQHEVTGFVDAMFYRLWLCRVNGRRDCRRIVDAFARMAAIFYRSVLA